MKSPALSAGETIEISRKIIPADKRASPFFEISIDLTEGITRLDVSFHYTKTDICVLDIGILDSSATDYPTRTGFRGWSGGARDRFFVATDEATPDRKSTRLNSSHKPISYAVFCLKKKKRKNKKTTKNNNT